MRATPIEDKTTLGRSNNDRHNWPKSICNDLRNNFVNNITKADQKKMFDRLRMINFRNEGNKGLVNVPYFLRIVENI